MGDSEAVRGRARHRTRRAFTGKTYGEYEKEAQRFVWKLFEVFKEGDGAGRPFFFPKPLVHITEKFFKTEGHEEFLDHICDVAADKGNTYYVFDRGDTAKISQCCRLSFKLEESDLLDAKEPWRMRYTALQNVSLNLPRLAYMATEGRHEPVQPYHGAVPARREGAQGEEGIHREAPLRRGGRTLSLLTMNRDGMPYLRMNRASHLVGMVGLNEMVQIHTGEEMHESKKALKFGLKIISHMKLLADRMKRQENMRLVLEQTPAESTSYRFAKLDLHYFSPASGRAVKGDVSSGEVYYTNSTHLNVCVPMNPIERVTSEGLFHPLIEAGSFPMCGWASRCRRRAPSPISSPRPSGTP